MLAMNRSKEEDEVRIGRRERVMASRNEKTLRASSTNDVTVRSICAPGFGRGGRDDTYRRTVRLPRFFYCQASYNEINKTEACA